MTTAEHDAAISRERRFSIFERWLMAIIAITLCGAIVVSAVALVQQGEIRSAAHDAKTLQERGDCRARISAEQNVIRDAALLAKSRLDQAYINAQLTPVTGPEDLANRRSTVQAFADALLRSNEALEGLPPLQSIVDKRCPSVGE